MSKKSIQKISIISLIAILFFFTSIFLISGQVPELHTIQGYIFHADATTQVPSGTTLTINATTTGTFITTQTSGPPGNTGFYAETINASDGETIIITAYNATYFGRNSTTLATTPDITRLNITLNTTRPPETDLDILSPSNNTYYDKFEVFNATFNITALGGSDALNCNATLTISDPSIINVTSGTNTTIQLGNIVLNTNKSGNFELEALSEGTITLTISSICSSDAESLENLNSETITLTVSNQPAQLHAIQGYVFHSDNTTQVQAGTNVTINATETGTFLTVQTSGPPGHTGFYSTTILARDGELVIVSLENETYEGNATTNFLPSPSVTRINVTLDILKTEPPYFTNVLVEDDASSPSDQIDLTAGGTKQINCSATVTDINNYTDIINVTAVFFDTSESSANSTDDNNNHYTNNSCTLFNCANNSCNVECTFQLQYYANYNETNGWLCQLNATDTANTSNIGQDNTSINSLLAIQVPDFIDYGEINPNTVSNESILNISNAGNIIIDISLEGYGNTKNDNYSMTCLSGSNISIEYEKYNLTASNPGTLTLTTFESLYTNLTNSPVNQTNFNLESRKNDTSNEAINNTYWRIFVPPGISGSDSCSGSINIGAISNT